MNAEEACLAIIPARGGSKGLPGKNIRPLKGKPLIAYSIEAAYASGCVDEVAVSTDSSEIAEVAKAAGARVPFLRPDALSSDEAKSIDVLRHAVLFYEQTLKRRFSTILLLQPTSPLRTGDDIAQAFAQFRQSGADSLQSVSPAECHPYLLRTLKEGRLESYEQQEVHLRRQDLEEVYALNGAIYIMKRELLIEQQRIVGARNTGYVMPRERSVDIDDRIDFRIAEVLLEASEEIDGQDGQ